MGSSENNEKLADAILAPLAAASTAGYIGEAVSQLGHALQAADAAHKAGADDEAVLAALLHDIGHLVAEADSPQMDGYGVAAHEELGAQWLHARGGSHRLCKLVASHVAAKRYLVATDPDYATHLSEASRATLAHQGGPLADEEVAAMETDPDFFAVLLVRACCDQAKDPAWRGPGLEAYRPMLVQHLLDAAQG